MAKDEDLYAKAIKEYESGVIDENLKIKAYVISNGDSNLEKFEYVRLRVEKIKQQQITSLPNRVARGAVAAAEAISAERAAKAAEGKEKKPNYVLMIIAGIILAFLLMIAQSNLSISSILYELSSAFE